MVVKYNVKVKTNIAQTKPQTQFQKKLKHNNKQHTVAQNDSAYNCIVCCLVIFCCPIAIPIIVIYIVCFKVKINEAKNTKVVVQNNNPNVNTNLNNQNKSQAKIVSPPPNKTPSKNPPHSAYKQVPIRKSNKDYMTNNNNNQNTPFEDKVTPKRTYSFEKKISNPIPAGYESKLDLSNVKLSNKKEIEIIEANNQSIEVKPPGE